MRDESCLQALADYAKSHFEQAFDEDSNNPDSENLFKVFRYFGAAYHTSDKDVGENLKISLSPHTMLSSSLLTELPYQTADAEYEESLLDGEYDDEDDEDMDPADASFENASPNMKRKAYESIGLGQDDEDC